ncbi:TPA: LOW QUALITY PROTEIN: hypothetical protein N0F65_001191 [Lagenidium giganteum]|uniref:CSC1/OSCA1-like cytosolic domain-containing protein n=1 Tax=Lagenidium giganteum TaxID=4803 RepID=A0AAV2Z4K3_9STRA|nr:TPA: LOW QUALITY PROTEIN: hypothetical protein N0F65_001191 [Lagenidium giganteum]
MPLATEVAVVPVDLSSSVPQPQTVVASPAEEEFRAGEATQPAAQEASHQARTSTDPGKNGHVVQIDVAAKTESREGRRKGSVDLDKTRVGDQLGEYPPDCGTRKDKFLSFDKVLRNRGMTHPMRYTDRLDKQGNPMPEYYPLSTDFGAHSFHRLPTDSLVLSQYGIGMALYFKFLKVMGWVFLLLCIVSIPALVIFIVGGTNSLQEFKQLAKQNLPLVLGMTSLGHLQQSSNSCDQVAEGQVLSLACPAGQIGFIKAVYSQQDSQGTCTCPERNKVAAGNGKCRGKPSVCPASATDCVPTCPAGNDTYGCFIGTHPLSQWTCCADHVDPKTKKPDFSEMRVRSMAGCGSGNVQRIVEGLCLGQKSCSFNVSEAMTYKWRVDEDYQTYCPNDKDNTLDVTCAAKITDNSDFSTCPDRSKRGLIVFARCFTTRIDLSNEWSMKIVGWDSMTREQFLGLTVGCDIAGSALFLIAVLWMKKKEKEAEERNTRDVISVADYTVQLVHLPRHTNTEKLKQELQEHLENLLTDAPKFSEDVDRIRIADIQFGKNNVGLLDLLRKRGVIVRKMEAEILRLDKIKSIMAKVEERLLKTNYDLKPVHDESDEDRRKRWSRFPDWRRIDARLQRQLKVTNKLDQQLTAEQNKIDEWNTKHKSSGTGNGVTAYITFEEEEGYHRCLTEYPNLGFLHRLFQSKRKRLHNKRLHFRRAPDPTDIVWENLQYSAISRFMRQIFTTLVTLGVLFMSFIIIFLAKLQKSKLEREFGRPSTCPVNVTSAQVVEDELNKIDGLVPYKALVECFCKAKLSSESFTKMKEEVFWNPRNQTNELYCDTWSTSFLRTQGLSVLSVLIVVFVNFALARIITWLVAIERHHTESGQIVSRVVKVFISQFFNTAILMIVINANMNYFMADKVINVSSFQILNGKYSDFTPTWYSDVGVALILTMIINTFSPHVFVIIQYLSQKGSRCWDRGCSFDKSMTKQVTQRDLEALYRGPKFDLASRYSQILTTIFITYLFSAGMPLLNYVGLLALIITYWADKFTFLRIARSPPLYDGKIASATGSLLPYAVLLHSLVAMWMYSNADIFQSESDVSAALRTKTSSADIGEDIPPFESQHAEVFGRVTRFQVVVLFAFFAGAGGLVVLKVLLLDYFPSFVQSICPVLVRLMQKPKIAKGVPNYFDAIPTMILREKVKNNKLKGTLRVRYEEALEKREILEKELNADGNQRKRRALSAAEQYSEARWIVGCHSYAMVDNKEYVDELAADSYISCGDDLESIL